jgi:hypothetical protein
MKQGNKKELQVVSGGKLSNFAKKEMKGERINGTKPNSMTYY